MYLPVIRIGLKTECHVWEAHGDIHDGVSWKAAMHLIISFGYFNRASENSSSEADKSVSDTYGLSKKSYTYPERRHRTR